MPTKIEWCDETLNPFWGCTHGCPYCQARRIAHMRAIYIGRLRGYPTEVIMKMKRFEPVWLPDADRILSQVEHWKKPRTIFIGFMGDIACQRDEDIRYMLDFAGAHPEHRFLILTKRLSSGALLFHPNKFQNIWRGYSDDGTQDLRQWVHFYSIKNTFVSFEPLISNQINLNPYLTRWIIIGALTDRRGQPVAPEKGGTRLEWVLPIIKIADKQKIPVFLKGNLLKLYPQLPKRQEFPWAK